MRKILGTILLSAISFAIYAQEAEGDSGYKKFAIKFCPTQLVAGELNFSYEQRVARIISLEMELGPTISQFGMNFGNQRLWQGNNGLEIWQFEPIDDDAKSQLGFHISLAPKFYPTSQGEEMKGLYLAPVFKYRKYNYTNEDINGNLGDAKAYIDQLIFRFNMGFQFWPGDGNFSIDMYFGVGLSTFNLKGNHLENYVDNQGFAQSRWAGYTDSGVRFNAATGLKFGFGK